MNYCNHDCQKARYQALKLDCRKAKAAGDKLAKEPARFTQHHLKSSTTRSEIVKQQAQIDRSTPNVPPERLEQSSGQTDLSISGNAGSRMVTVRHPNGTEIPVTADRVMMKKKPPTPEDLQGYTQFVILDGRGTSKYREHGRGGEEGSQAKARRGAVCQERCAKGVADDEGNPGRARGEQTNV